MIGKLAFRNLFRNRWRSALTGGGVAVAVALLIWSNAFIEGFVSEMIRGATSVQLGQVQIHSTEYAEEEAIWKSFAADEALFERLGRAEHVRAVAPRVEYYGLIGTEKQSQVARIVGVDSQRERAVTPIEEGVVEGRWLSDAPPDRPAPREVVLGADLAGQIGAEVGDELVIFAEAKDGSLGNDLLKVVGLVESKNTSIDRRTAFMHLSDAQFVGALQGEVHEIAIRTDAIRHAGASARAVRELLRGRDASGGSSEATELTVRPWRKLVPELYRTIEVTANLSWIFYLIVYFIAALGILNTQRMSALERHREFGVMQAIGMTPDRLFWAVMVETVLLTILGALVGAVLGLAGSWYFAEYGFNLGWLADEDSFSYMGIAFSERIHFVITPQAVLYPMAVVVPVAAVCGLWPAISSAGLDPAVAISGRD